jgi:hypothetical protein
VERRIRPLQKQHARQQLKLTDHDSLLRISDLDMGLAGGQANNLMRKSSVNSKETNKKQYIYSIYLLRHSCLRGMF